MSIGSVTSNAPIKEITNTSKSDKTTLQLLKEKFVAGKNYILNHKGAFAKIGQIGGTAALITGGASLLFSGIAANLTVAGVPLGIPLMVAGGILLAAGTILQVAHHVEKKGLSVGEKIKGFFQETFNNVKIGALIGVGVSAACAVAPLEQLVAAVPVIMKLKSSLSESSNKEESWENIRKKIAAQFPASEEILKESKSPEEFLKKLSAHLEATVDSIEKREKNEARLPVSTDDSSLENFAASSALGLTGTKN